MSQARGPEPAHDRNLGRVGAAAVGGRLDGGAGTVFVAAGAIAVSAQPFMNTAGANATIQ
jgi:hypothetical protein